MEQGKKPKALGTARFNDRTVYGNTFRVTIITDKMLSWPYRALTGLLPG